MEQHLHIYAVQISIFKKNMYNINKYVQIRRGKQIIRDITTRLIHEKSAYVLSIYFLVTKYCQVSTSY
jgi:hypothetical protein